MIIRDMERDDWNAVAEIYKEGMDAGTSTFTTELPTYEEFDASHCKCCRLVAEEDGRVVAWVTLYPYSSRAVYSGVAALSIYVKNEYQGKKIGGKLLEELFERSEKEGFWTLQSNIFEINTRSIALHKKLGFRMVGYRERLGKDKNGVWQNVVLMERRSKLS